MGRPRKNTEETQKRPRGRPPFKVTKEMREAVEWRAAMGWTIHQCALEIGISEPTFRLHFEKNYEAGKLRKRGKIIDMLVKNAEENSNVSAQKALYAMTVAQPGETAGTPAEKKPRQMQLGKKQVAQIAAETAGDGTSWGDDLIPETFKPNLN